MKQIADGVFPLGGFPPAAFNVYLIRSGDEQILVDTSTRHARRRILRQLPNGLDAILITHAHRDHAGSMHAVATATGAPVWASAADSDALEGKAPDPMPEQHRDHIVNRLFAGKVVRKDLVRKVKVGANVPVFVLEFLLGKYCASSDEVSAIITSCYSLGSVCGEMILAKLFQHA